MQGHVQFDNKLYKISMSVGKVIILAIKFGTTTILTINVYKVAI